MTTNPVTIQGALVLLLGLLVNPRSLDGGPTGGVGAVCGGNDGGTGGTAGGEGGASGGEGGGVMAAATAGATTTGGSVCTGLAKVVPHPAQNNDPGAASLPQFVQKAYVLMRRCSRCKRL